MAEHGAWWREGIFYQIYPRSFQDSDGDGGGDLTGIIHRLPYLMTLGVDAIWLSPIFTSPMADFGYDIADYTGIDPLFGTMEDFDALVKAAHDGRLKVILDLVPNHTSNQHPWFLQARQSRDDPHRDWYIWRDPAPDGGPPNNLLSEFGGSAWQFDEATGQYYYHAFLAQHREGGEIVTVALNLSDEPVAIAIEGSGLDGEILLSTWLDRDGERIDGTLDLRGNEGVVIGRSA